MMEMFKKAEVGNAADARDYLRALDRPGKKAGIDSGIHVYWTSTGGFFGGAGSQTVGNPSPKGLWLGTFYSWMVANGFVKSE